MFLFSDSSVCPGDSRRHVDGVLRVSSSTWGTEKEKERADGLKSIVPLCGRVSLYSFSLNFL